MTINLPWVSIEIHRRSIRQHQPLVRPQPMIVIGYRVGAYYRNLVELKTFQADGQNVPLGSSVSSY